MKRSFVITILLIFSMYPVIAQSVTAEEPVESLKLKKSDIPLAVTKSADKLFEGNTQVKWGKFPYELKDYGWYVNKDATEPIDHYEIMLKGTDGSDIYAVFKPNGDLIKSKIINKNAEVPKMIRNSLATGEYKDWHIVGDIMEIKTTGNNVDEHYEVKLEKNGTKKTLYYAPDGNLLSMR